MEISFGSEVEATIARIASECGRPPSQIFVELVTTQLEHDAWFRREVQKGITSLDSGSYVDDEEVAALMQQILHHK